MSCNRIRQDIYTRSKKDEYNSSSNNNDYLHNNIMDPKPADYKSRVKECGVDEEPVIHPVSQTVAVDCASKISVVELSPSKSNVSPSQVEDKPKTSAAKPKTKATKKIAEPQAKPGKNAKATGKANTPS